MHFFKRMSKRSRSKIRDAMKSVKAKKRSRSASAKLAAQTKSLKSAKLAAVRQLANAATAGFLGIEKKFLDMAKESTAIAANAALTAGEYNPSSGCTGCLSCPAEGDSEQQRDGKKFVIDSLILKGYVMNGESTGEAPESSTKVFVAVVLDTQTNGAQMESEDCFKNTYANPLTNADPMKNLLSGNRFRILKSQVFDLTPTGISAAAATTAHWAVRREIDWYIPFKGGLQVNLKAGDGNSGKNADVANVVDNSLHVIAFSTVGGSTIAYNARIRFQG